MSNNVLWYSELGMGDVEIVGGKNASLGEMISNLAASGVSVPNGFATTASAFREFLAFENLAQRIQDMLSSLDIEDVIKLAETGRAIRALVANAPFPAALEQDIRSHYEQLVSESGAEISVAVRSSATAEDLPDASFAGQQETYLNVQGIDNVLHAIKEVFASLYNDRAIAYRVHHGFEHAAVALSAGVQRMVRSDKGASGVMFTMDTESGFNNAVFITSSYGLGEAVVQGAVNPDEFYAYKPALREGRPAVLRRGLGEKARKMIYTSDRTLGKTVEFVDVDAAERRQFSLSDDEVQALAKQALIIEEHYGRPMDIEWGRDGIDGKLYILQARPETVKSRSATNVLRRYKLKNKGKSLTSGRAIGQKIGAGSVRILSSIDQMTRVQPGDVLVTDMTDPDWEPIMKRASAIVTNRGGRTCHAAIIARELGIPAVVGCGDATQVLRDGDPVTVTCAEGDTGYIYEGHIDFEVDEVALDKMPDIPVKVMMNVGTPEQAFDFAALPHKGVGLARLEFIINRQIGIHPQALLELDRLPPEERRIIDPMIAPYGSPRDYFIKRLAEGIATIAAAFAPEPVIVRLSDFKSNEYANLIAGRRYEPHEENPMLGFRGASRYISPTFRPCFEMECAALKYVRDEMGLTNVKVMVPFVRTLDEARQVVDILAENGLKRGDNGLQLIMMCELPSNAVLAEQFLEYFDGFSIGSNDMTQLTLGLDRDSGLIAHLFDERNEAVKAMLSMAISACRKQGKYIGICGQGPSDHPDLARWLLDQGIESMSLNPDTVVETWLFLAGQKA
ncbi:phosphoenolpyruvate synthase [Sinimarinibacterium sp. NLF-5-8]|uniref:phosphoenolpyruvate synthase n=1 Tax=Sinimarinibacterium sp. NLF-5-8 TaxID=2698684 RepID=UPI00137BE165|nr:phosphoenolpyruvate synthase [Sinimarinibacterium sp. NLF-5-8]QHS09709.1 phosphoenolpyruvate synthase [Sinimarinibacterium sp. NLF-5-8]